MKAITLIKNGPSEEALEFRDVAIPTPGDDEVVIKNEAFGLNYADVMARKGLYNDAPPLPCVMGYEVVGHIHAVGKNVTHVKEGQRVLAFCRFGGYAEYTITRGMGAIPIPDSLPTGQALAMATQYCTAYHAACELINLFHGDFVLVHAAAGGVGTALIQLAKMKGCTVLGTVGSDAKKEYILDQGADYVINYKKVDFVEETKRLLGETRLDAVFDPIGGKSFRKSLSLVGSAGKAIIYGSANWSDTDGGLIAKLKLVWGFGFLHPLGLMMKSKSVIGVNMLRVGDHKPEVIHRCITEVIELYKKGLIAPHVGGSFKAEEIAKAHDFLESRKSVGKIEVTWL